MTGFLLVSGVALVVAALAMVLTGWAAVRSGRVSVVDTTWGLALVAIAVSSAVVGATLGTADWRSWLLVGLVGVWGGRLSWHMHRRNHGAAEDPRYAELLGGTLPAPGVLRVAIRKVFLIQGLAVWLVSLPVQVAAVTATQWPLVAALGAVVWLVGLVFETVGDTQLAAYRAQPRELRPPVLDTGLWGLTRHPNYFGDACVWVGIWLVSSAAWPGLLTFPAPLAMTYFLAFATGARLLERTMMQRPGYREYAARVPMFVPRLVRVRR